MDNNIEILKHLYDDEEIRPVSAYNLFISVYCALGKSVSFDFFKKFIIECRPAIIINGPADFVNINLTAEEFKKFVMITQDETQLKTYTGIDLMDTEKQGAK